MSKGYWFFQSDFRDLASEPPWTIGETRVRPRSEDTTNALAPIGYPWARSWLDAFKARPAPVAAIVEVSRTASFAGWPKPRYSVKRQLVAAKDAHKELTLAACDCLRHVTERVWPLGTPADRMLDVLIGIETDMRYWQEGKITRGGLNHWHGSLSQLPLFGNRIPPDDIQTILAWAAPDADLTLHAWAMFHACARAAGSYNNDGSVYADGYRRNWAWQKQCLGRRLSPLFAGV